MAGLLAVSSFDELWDVANVVRGGTAALSHRGQSSYVVCYVAEGLKCVSEGVPSSAGTSAIAVVGKGEEATASHGSCVVVALSDRPFKALGEVAEVMAKALSMESGRLEALRRSLEGFAELPSFVALTNTGDVVVHRDKEGLTPLVLGGYGFDMALATSESAAIEALGGETRKLLVPGEAVYLSKRLAAQLLQGSRRPQRLCLFEPLSLARTHSSIGEVCVYAFRRALGRKLARRFAAPERLDVVTGIPGSAAPYAIGFAEAVGRPYDELIVLTGTYTPSLTTNYAEVGVVRGVAEGRRLALVECGNTPLTTLRRVVHTLRFKVGVEELHVLMALPRLHQGCPYGVADAGFVAGLSDEELAAYLEADSVTRLEVGDIDEVAKEMGLSLCGECLGRRLMGC